MKETIEIEPSSGALGTEVSGVQIGEALSNKPFDTIYQALNDYRDFERVMYRVTICCARPH